MLHCLERFRAMYAAHGVPHLVFEDKLYRSHGLHVLPQGPAKLNYSISRESARQILSQSGAWLLRWTDGFGEAKWPEFYAVICDRFVDLPDIDSHMRSQIRRGLKNCDVRRVDAAFVAEKCYETYRRAFDRYSSQTVHIWEPEVFRARILMTADYDDIVHYWVAFHNDEIVGFSINDVYDRIEAGYVMIKLDPEHLKLYPMYALIHRMNEYYLGQEHFEYVNDGWRSLLHDSNVQSFLVSKFGFRLAHSNLRVCYSPLLGSALRLSWPFRDALGSRSVKLKSLYELERIRRG